MALHPCSAIDNERIFATNLHEAMNTCNIALHTVAERGYSIFIEEAENCDDFIWTAAKKEEYCFGTDGKGMRTIYHTDGEAFRGPMTARFDAQGNLLLDVEVTSEFSDGTGWSKHEWYDPESVICVQSGTLNCTGTVAGGDCIYTGVYYRK
jgi:hypothetical protein